MLEAARQVAEIARRLAALTQQLFEFRQALMREARKAGFILRGEMLQEIGGLRQVVRELPNVADGGFFRLLLRFLQGYAVDDSAIIPGRRRNVFFSGRIPEWRTRWRPWDAIRSRRPGHAAVSTD